MFVPVSNIIKSRKLTVILAEIFKMRSFRMQFVLEISSWERNVCLNGSVLRQVSRGKLSCAELVIENP